VATAIEREAPGAARLVASMNAFLDGCLADPGTKGLLVQARTDAGLAAQVAERNTASAQIICSDLEVLGWNPALPIAELLVAAVADIALRELASGHPEPELRRAAVRLATHAP
jgi:hypothetical protein